MEARYNSSGKLRLNTLETEIRESVFGDISQASGNTFESAWDFVKHSSPEHPEVLVEAIITWFQKKFGLDEFELASKEFQQMTGKVFYDDPSYHSRIQYFLDYFIFQRPFQGTSLQPESSHRPIDIFLSSTSVIKELNKEILGDFESLKETRHSLFKVKKIKHGKMTLEDCLLSKSFVVENDDQTFYKAFSKGMIFQCFLYRFHNSFKISTGVVIHPLQATTIIKKLIRPFRKNMESNESKILVSLAKKNIDFLRQPNASCKKVYSPSLII